MDAELLRLLGACKDAPDETLPRLVLADWLDDHGDAERAEFVRLSVRLDRGVDGIAPLPEDEPDWAGMAARRHRLWLKNRKRWLGGLASEAWLGSVGHEAGMLWVLVGMDDLPTLKPEVAAWIEEARLSEPEAGEAEVEAWSRLLPVRSLGGFGPLPSPAALTRLLEEPGRPPLRRLSVGLPDEIWRVREHARTLAASRGIRWLDFRAGLEEQGEALYPALATGSGLAECRVLGLSFCPKACLPHVARAVPRIRALRTHQSERGDAMLGALAANETLAGLESLASDYDNVSDTGLKALAASPYLRRLKSLSFEESSRITGRGLAALARSPVMASVERLSLLWSCQVGVEGVRALAASPFVGSLRELALSGPLGDEGAEAIASSPALSGLRVLRLDNCGIGARGAERLASSPHLSRLEVLSLRGNSLLQSGVEALAQAGALPALRSLRLFWDGLPAAAVRALAACPMFRRLRCLSLSCPRAGAAIGADLAASPSQLESLDLSNSRLRDDGLAALLRAPWVKNLRNLRLGGNRISAAGIEALVKTRMPQLAFLDLQENSIRRQGGQLLAAWRQARQMSWLGLPQGMHPDDQATLFRSQSR